MHKKGRTTFAIAKPRSPNMVLVSIVWQAPAVQTKMIQKRFPEYLPEQGLIFILYWIF